MNNIKLNIILSSLCVMFVFLVIYTYHENKKQRKLEYERILSDANQQLEELQHWRKSKNFHQKSYLE